MVVGGVGLNVGRILTLAEASAPDELDGPCCSICLRPASSRRRLAHLALEAIDPDYPDERGPRAGRIRLCEPCWSAATKGAR